MSRSAKPRLPQETGVDCQTALECLASGCRIALHQVNTSNEHLGQRIGRLRRSHLLQGGQCSLEIRFPCLVRGEKQIGLGIVGIVSND